MRRATWAVEGHGEPRPDEFERAPLGGYLFPLPYKPLAESDALPLSPRRGIIRPNQQCPGAKTYPVLKSFKEF